MEFNEKLQKLRRAKGITQEQLAEELYVSRTAVSKWESGRGYPGIDSLKRIAEFFSVTVDDLLSGKEIMNIAQNENKENTENLCGLFLGFADVLYFVLMVLPLYPKPRDGYIFAVNLFDYTDISPAGMLLYLVLFAGLVITGALKIAASYFGYQKYGKILTAVSFTLGVLTVLFLAMHREPYAASISFLLFALKAVLVMKCEKISR